MPRDFSGFGRFFSTKDNPDMILRHGKMNVIETKQLTCGDHTQGHAKTVQLVLYNNRQTDRQQHVLWYSLAVL